MLLRALLACLLLATSLCAEPRVILTKVWDAAPHNAFTDLLRWRDAWWLVFRESEAHVGGDGKIRVLTSADGVKWESAAVLAEEGTDLRDPKLCVGPEDRLMLTAGGSVYGGGAKLLGRQSRVFFSADGKAWSPGQRVLAEGDWLWRVTWHAGTAYGVAYRSPEEGEWSATLVKSEDGVKWDAVAKLAVPDRPNEATVRFDMRGEMLILIRREAGDKQAWLGRASAPFTDWTWRGVGRFIGGPNFLAPPNSLFAAGRDLGPEGPRTALGPIADGLWTPSLTLPSGGDTGYAGMWFLRGEWVLSYYSSHEGKSAIYLARITGL